MLELIVAGSAGLSAIGQIAAGRAQQQASQLNAFQMETEKKLNKTQALQMSRARREEYNLATSANIAAFAASGRDVTADVGFAQQQDKSVQAFLQRQKDIIDQDTSRIDQQVQFQNMKTSMAAMAERRRGRNALTASLFSAIGTVSQGIYQYETVRTK
jgi:hypothetical protein